MRVSVRPQRSSKRYQSGVVACETGDFEAEHDTDVAEDDFGGQLGKAVSLGDTSSGEPEIFIDDDNLLRRPP